MSITGHTDAMTTNLSTKPIVKFNHCDWMTNKHAISSDAEKTRNVSFQVRQEGRFLNNETDNQTWWDTHDNNVRLSDRLDDIEEWRQVLRYQIGDIDKELEAIRLTKHFCENMLNDMKVPLDVNIENHVTRDGRLGVDLVRDEPESELKKETNVIDAIKRQLHQKCQESFDQIRRLDEARQQLLNDLNDKNVAHAIDEENLILTKHSSAISFKPNPLRIPKGSVTPQQWLAFSKYNKDRSDAEMQSSKRLRENIQHTMSQSTNNMNSQKNATEYAMRKRIHETEQARDELGWQKKNVQKFIFNFLFFYTFNFNFILLFRPNVRSLNWREILRRWRRRSVTRIHA
jgi:tektin-2